MTFANPAWKETFNFLKNFGLESEVEVVMPATNAKMNELQALMGLLVLDRLDEIIRERSLIHQLYIERLSRVPGIRVPSPAPPDVCYNHAYFPIEVDHHRYGLDRDGLYEWLREHNVLARRYFYPLITEFECYRSLVSPSPLPVSRGVASRILTLPIYNGLELEDVERICEIIASRVRDRSSLRGVQVSR